MAEELSVTSSTNAYSASNSSETRFKALVNSLEQFGVIIDPKELENPLIKRLVFNVDFLAVAKKTPAGESKEDDLNKIIDELGLSRNIIAFDTPEATAKIALIDDRIKFSCPKNSKINSIAHSFLDLIDRAESFEERKAYHNSLVFHLKAQGYNVSSVRYDDGSIFELRISQSEDINRFNFSPRPPRTKPLSGSYPPSSIGPINPPPFIKGGRYDPVDFLRNGGGETEEKGFRFKTEKKVLETQERIEEYLFDKSGML